MNNILISEDFKFNIINSTPFEILDGDATKSVKVKIEASHAGIINNNNIMYTPRALRQAAESLLSPYKKMLQKKHYSTSVGPITNSIYESTNTSIEDKLEQAKDPSELVKTITSYMSSKEYKADPKGIGALFVEGEVYDKKRISELREGHGFVSIAGDAIAYCSICASHANRCMHKKGSTYNKRKAYIIVDSLSLDHVSFETVPADTETGTVIIADSSTNSTLEILNITNQGSKMSLSLQDLKDKLSDFESLYKEFDFKNSVMVQDSENLSDYLFPEEKLLPLTTAENVAIADSLVETLAEESVEGAYLRQKVAETYCRFLVNDMSKSQMLSSLKYSEHELAAAKALLQASEEVHGMVAPEPETSVMDNSESLTVLTDLLKSIEARFDTLEAKLDSTSVKVQDSLDQPNTLLQQDVKALRSDLLVKQATIDTLTQELRTSILDAASYKIEDSAKEAFFNEFKDAPLVELKTAMKLVNSLQKQTKGETVEVQDAQEEQPIVVEEVTIEPVTIEDAAEEAGTEEVQDVDPIFAIVDSYVNSISAKFGDVETVASSKLETEFKTIAIKDSFDVAKKVTLKLKDKYKFN